MLDVWEGNFGDEYTKRNIDASGRKGMWRRILNVIQPSSILEVGANIGANLNAIDELINAELIGLEPNETARSQILFDSIDGTAQNIQLESGAVEMVFTCGVLIHIPPVDLGVACDEIYRVSSKYIVCIEYFSDTPEKILYRECDNLLFKRDFGSYWLDRFPSLKAIDYGFFWKRTTGLDNLTYWIFEKEIP